jgi:hypothetical protein
LPIDETEQQRDFFEEMIGEVLQVRYPSLPAVMQSVVDMGVQELSILS